MKDDPRFTSASQPPDGRDTRLDPIDLKNDPDVVGPDATQPGSILTGPAAAKLITPHHPTSPPHFGRSPQGVGGAPFAQHHAQQQITGPIRRSDLPIDLEVDVDLAFPAADTQVENIVDINALGLVLPTSHPHGGVGGVGGPTPRTSSDLGIFPPDAGTDHAFRPSDMPPADAFRARAPRLRTGWPFLPIGPLLVVVVGLAVALGIGLVGLDQLARAGDEHAGARAELLAATVAARLAALPTARRFDATQLAARRSQTELLVVTPQGEIIHDITLAAPDLTALKTMLATGHGVIDTRSIGRARYAVRAIGADPNAPRLVVLVPEPRTNEGANALVLALAALSVLLLGVAAGVAYAVSRDVTRDVDFVTDRVNTMAQIRTEPTGELIPARTMDEVGILTATFNKLVGRFGIAERAYRSDLARASAADRERAAFLAAVSHELRSPLNAILGFADILMEEVDGPLSPTAREEVEQIRGSGVHLLGLINDILEFSALESGQLRLTRGRVDLLGLANEVIREARGLVGDRPLVVRVEGESCIARVDGRRVRQILGNLVNNAIKFTQQGHVIVRVTREGPSVALSVSDTGPGISEQERAVIFEEYKQAKNERTRRRGTGLGLAITRRLVMLHHGSIGVDSELGRGSTFKVLLPIGNIDAPPSRKMTRPPSTVDGMLR